MDLIRGHNSLVRGLLTSLLYRVAYCHMCGSKFLMMKLDHLPDDCIGHILSFTSPRDVCKSSLVSTVVRYAAESDVVWENFLPFDYEEILSRLVSPMVFSSKKELFRKLCNQLLIDEGKMTFSLEKSKSKKCYMMSARELSIRGSSYPLYWSWKPYLQSRFAEIADLNIICWLEIIGKMKTRMLSPKTIYGAYLIMKFTNCAYGLDSLPSEVSVEVGNYQSQGTVYLRRHESKKQSLERLYFSNRIEALGSTVFEGEGRVPCEREDGWMEIELGDFYNDGGDEEVKMSLREMKGGHLKGGLTVEGIELRSKD